MKFSFTPGTRVTAKIGSEYYPLKVVRDTPNTITDNQCHDCFFLEYFEEYFENGYLCQYVDCSATGNNFHLELDTQTSSENERH